jgi:8-oxo-dGTP pyrophosphatase MutT (NUDIX family)
MNMKTEKACGAVIEKDGKILVIYQNNGFWGFPKGHVEDGETEKETAEREILEETGLKVEVNVDNRFEFSYDIEKSNVHKIVVLFTAKVVDDSNFKKQDEEIAEMRWIEPENVEEILTFDDWKDVWRKIKNVI